MRRNSGLMFLLAVILGCCAAPATPSSAGGSSPPLAGDLSGPRISWDHPFMGEGRTNVDESSLIADPRSYALSIVPTIPSPSGGKLRWIDVSAHGTVAFMYSFSGDPRFPLDGRVQIEESPSTMTQAQLVAAPWSGTHSFISVGALTILLRQNNGLADASFIHGGVLYDIAGPALSPQAALDLAGQLAAKLG